MSRDASYISTVARLDSTCTVLGLVNEWGCSVRECSLGLVDTLAIYTDGITEAFNAAEEEFGEERLIEALQGHRELPARELLAAVVERSSPGEQYDDITLIVARGR